MRTVSPSTEKDGTGTVEGAWATAQIALSCSENTKADVSLSPLQLVISSQVSVVHSGLAALTNLKGTVFGENMQKRVTCLRACGKT